MLSQVAQFCSTHPAASVAVCWASWRVAGVFVRSLSVPPDDEGDGEGDGEAADDTEAAVDRAADGTAGQGTAGDLRWYGAHPKTDGRNPSRVVARCRATAAPQAGETVITR
jgi:hypothetical protein